ncbi:MAG TPA: putative DNA-binding domain-containing protein [Woeseiaceae bacterium]|nr:putative DNA-binding domain-containing protein [Woeseiaceae bacterium]
MADADSFQDKQYAFAAHIRDPEHFPAPEDIEDRRVALYRDLFFNNLRNLLGTMFPVLRKIHGEQHWALFVREFMRRHQSKTPYFLKLPEEFLDFLQHEYTMRDNDYPFLNELAHYEYIELALSVSTDTDDLSGVDPAGDLLDAMPVRSVLAWVFAYRFPVHRISKSYLPRRAPDQASYLAVYRRSDDKVRFLELNAMTAALLRAMEENKNGRTGRQLLLEMAKVSNYTDTVGFEKYGAAMLEDLRKLGIVTGSRNV